MGLFSSSPFQDPELGLFKRSGGNWHGTISIEGREIVLSLAGDRKAPDHASLELAKQLRARMSDLKPQIAQGLFEHYEPYRDAATGGELPARGGDAAFPDIVKVEDVWRHVEVSRITVGPLRGAPTEGPVVEVAYRTSWDDEHTVGARIQNWRLFELCGSL